MKVLIIGGGGREHALLWKIGQSTRVSKLYCAPGNAGTEEIATNVDLPAEDVHALASWTEKNGIDLTIVGPEGPLAKGLVDVFSSRGLKVFGPSAAAAELEASKSFAKEVMEKAGVRTAHGEVFADIKLAREYIEKQGAPIVVKADGLASGKGVVVAQTEREALQALEKLMKLGSAQGRGGKVVLEKCLHGEEASVIAIVDGQRVFPFVVSQDYKRLYDHQEGPNTGGMGAISPTPVLDYARVEGLIEEVFLPVSRELLRRGIHYRGFLYAGVMVDEQGEAHVLEFNCRLGDPETQVLLMRLKSDLLELLERVIDGQETSIPIEWRKDTAACVVACSRGYPEKVDDGKPIAGLFQGTDGLQIFHAGTIRNADNPEKILTKGGRVLSVAALGSTLAEAVKRAYAGMERISYDGIHFRRDIGNSR